MKWNVFIGRDVMFTPDDNDNVSRITYKYLDAVLTNHTALSIHPHCKDTEVLYNHTYMTPLSFFSITFLKFDGILMRSAPAYLQMRFPQNVYTT